MSRKTSAGILLYRTTERGLEVFLVHPGGPFWAKKDAGAWSIPKGEIDDDDEDALATAVREFREETGHAVAGTFVALAPRRQRSGKVVHAWALRGDLDPSTLTSNTFEMEWPPGSGRHREFPEVDRGGWFTIAQARYKLLAGQIGFLDELEAVVPVVADE